MSNSNHFKQSLSVCEDQNQDMLNCRYRKTNNGSEFGYFIFCFLQVYLVIPYLIDIIRFMVFKRLYKGKSLIELFQKYCKCRKPKNEKKPVLKKGRTMHNNFASKFDSVDTDVRNIMLKELDQQNNTLKINPNYQQAMGVGVLRKLTQVHPKQLGKTQIIKSQASPIYDHEYDCKAFKRVKVNSPQRSPLQRNISNIQDCCHTPTKEEKLEMKKIQKIKPARKRTLVDLAQYIPEKFRSYASQQNKKETKKETKKVVEKVDSSFGESISSSKKSDKITENKRQRKESMFFATDLTKFQNHNRVWNSTSDTKELRSGPKDQTLDQPIIYESNESSYLPQNISKLSNSPIKHRPSASLDNKTITNNILPESMLEGLEVIDETNYVNSEKIIKNFTSTDQFEAISDTNSDHHKMGNQTSGDFISPIHKTGPITMYKNFTYTNEDLENKTLKSISNISLAKLEIKDQGFRNSVSENRGYNILITDPVSEGLMTNRTADRRDFSLFTDENDIIEEKIENDQYIYNLKKGEMIKEEIEDKSDESKSRSSFSGNDFESIDIDADNTNQQAQVDSVTKKGVFNIKVQNDENIPKLRLNQKTLKIDTRHDSDLSK